MDPANTEKVLTTTKQAHAYLIDPLNAPEPSQETGPGSHFVRPESSASSVPSSSTNPFRKNSPHNSPQSKDFGASTHVRQVSGSSTHVRQTSREFGSPSGSPRSDKFPRYREEALGGLNDSPPPRRSNDGARPPTYDDVTTGRRRGSSLKERYPGDMSNKPLDIIRRDSRKAARAPHLRKNHIPGADVIDRLDPTINKIPYHHEGPYDAALLARNTDVKYSPVAALKDSNEEALKATAGENVRDALEKHKPLDGVAIVPPGVPDQFGRVRHYEEGTNERLTGGGGDYKKYDGIVRTLIQNSILSKLLTLHSGVRPRRHQGSR